MKNNQRPKLLFSTPDGKILEHPTWEMALDNGATFVRPGRKDLIAVRSEWDIMTMPGTRPVGFDPERGVFAELKEFTIEGADGTPKTIEPHAVAIHPPPGFVRRFHAAAAYLDETHPDEKFKTVGGGKLVLFEDNVAGGDDAARPGLPLWAYTAVGFIGKNKVAAVFEADETSRWSPDLYYEESLPKLVKERLAQDPDNRVLKQLSVCATEYRCCCAQNIFYERWEGAVPTAPACTASCLGCLSKDPAWNTESPQKRLKFSPKPEEIGRIMSHHLLTAPEPMVSFGQGCEGEPTMNGDVMVDSIIHARKTAPDGIININTNGSRPETIRRAAEAGANALRISINTFDKAMYDAYYRPADYTIDDVLRSLEVGRDGGMYLSLNLLIWPGWTDRMAEVDAISELVERKCLHMIQLRNLCVDPGHFRTVLPPVEERGILLGMHGFVEELHRRHPELRFGTFNPRLAADWYDDVPAWVGSRASVTA